MAGYALGVLSSPFAPPQGLRGGWRGVAASYSRRVIALLDGGRHSCLNWSRRGGCCCGRDVQAGLAVPATTIHVITTGGMAGWQITLIALGAALIAATLVVFADRARVTRRSASTTA